LNDLEDHAPKKEPGNGHKVLLKALEDYPSITDLDISSNNGQEPGSTEIAHFIKKITHVKTLNISGTYGTYRDQVAKYAEAFAVNRSITTLLANTTFVQCGSEAFQVFLEGLNKQPNITTLDLEDSQMYEDGVIAFAEYLKTNTTVTSLNIQSAKINNHWQHAYEAFKANKTLRSINLCDNGLDGEKFAKFMDVLKVNPTLTDINLMYNNFGDAGAKLIAENLASNNSLTRLHLNGTGIKKDGFAALVESLKTNKSLVELDLSGSGIEEDHLKLLAEALKSNTTFKTAQIGNYGNGGIKSEAITTILFPALPAGVKVSWDLSAGGTVDEFTIHRN